MSAFTVQKRNVTLNTGGEAYTIEIEVRWYEENQSISVLGFKYIEGDFWALLLDFQRGATTLGEIQEKVLEQLCEEKQERNSK